jgi:aryl-alcohol dehydrogenase-like predicted oxidoreductase
MNKSKVVIGTWPLSGDLGKVTSTDVYRTLEYCAKKGLKQFDTAPNYGNGSMENYIGEVFNGDKNIIINTKCGNSTNNIKDFSFSSLKNTFDNSLNRLKVEKVQTLFLHNPRLNPPNLSSAIQFLEDEKNLGRIKYCGISIAKDFDYDSTELKTFDAIQNDLNLLYLKPIISENYHNSFFYARSPLATGILAGNINTNTVFSPEDYRSCWLKGERLKSIMKRVNKIKSYINIPLPKFSRQFLLQHNFPQKVIFGVKNCDHVDDILNDLYADPISSDLINKIVNLYIDDYGLSKKHDNLGY